MRRIGLGTGGGFPFTQETLQFMETAYGIFNKIGYLVDHEHAIVSGCEENNNIAQNGVVFYQGKLYELVGGAVEQYVRIIESSENVIYENGVQQDAYFVSKMTFTPTQSANTIEWSLFKRPQTMTQTKIQLNNAINRIVLLETRLNKSVPIGLVAVWDKPASEPIPEGWVEHTPLRGKYPKGHSPNNLSNIGAIGDEGGSIEHEIASVGVLDFSDPDPALAFAKLSTTNGEQSVVISKRKQIDVPYRIIRFIRFVGFGPNDLVVDANNGSNSLDG